MELYLDTADVAAVKRLARVLPLQGVTTNPSILAKAGKSLWEVLPALRDALGGTGKLFAQVLASDSERMVSEAVQLSEQIPGLVIKIPVTAEGLAAIKKLKTMSIPTLVPRYTAQGKGYYPCWRERNMSHRMSIDWMRKGVMGLLWYVSCSSYSRYMPQTLKCWRPVFVHLAKYWIVCWPVANRSLSRSMWQSSLSVRLR